MRHNSLFTYAVWCNVCAHKVRALGLHLCWLLCKHTDACANVRLRARVHVQSRLCQWCFVIEIHKLDRATGGREGGILFWIGGTLRVTPWDTVEPRPLQR